MSSKMDAFDRAAGYLTVQPRTRAEIRAYLKKKEYSPLEIDEAMERLQEYNYADDAAYAENFFRQSAARG